MRHTLMLNLDDIHAKQLDTLSRRFSLSAEETLRMAVRFTHAAHAKDAGARHSSLKPAPARNPHGDNSPS